jgi:hypothetical protein
MSYERPFQKHSDTSRDAAESMRPTAATLREAVFNYLFGRGSDGATDEEIQIDLDMAGNTERPRRRELQEAGKVRDSGMRRTTKTGRQAVATRQPTQRTPLA